MHLCFLCKESASEAYNVVTTNVFDNSKVLITLLEEVTNNKSAHRTGNEICSKCYQLLNELHDYQEKIREISDKLHSYLISSDGVNKEDIEIKTADDFKVLESEERVIFQKNADKKHFTCHVCYKIFVSKSGFTKHLKRQHSETNCENVDIHVKVETKCSNYSINEDASQNNSTNNISTRRETSEKPRIYQCTQCPKKWKTAGELKNHLYAHSNVKPFICEICGQGYKHKSALDVHVGMHNGVCPFTCVYCKKTFTQKGALRRHLPIHTGETPYQCDLCGKRFIHHTSFKIHSLSHTGQKSHKCDTCGLALLSASHLKRHMRVHTGEKKYVCSVCGKRFAERYNLASHQKLHDSPSSKKRNQKCHICGVFCNKKHHSQELTETGIPPPYSDGDLQNTSSKQEFLYDSTEKYS